MYPNTSLAAWQLAVMAVVPVAALAVWLIAIFIAARDPGRHRQAMAGSGLPDVAGGRERPPSDRPPADRSAAEHEQTPAEQAAA